MSTAPHCEVCEDDGYIDVMDEETGGVLGPAPCPRGCEVRSVPVPTNSGQPDQTGPEPKAEGS